MNVHRAPMADDDQVRPKLRAVTFWIGLLGSVAIWAILATVCLRLF